MTTRELIEPVLKRIYGDGKMVEGLAKDLASRIDNFKEREVCWYGDNQRHTMIRDTCWNWFSGGGTADYAATKIEDLLETAKKMEEILYEES